VAQRRPGSPQHAVVVVVTLFGDEAAGDGDIQSLRLRRKPLCRGPFTGSASRSTSMLSQWETSRAAR